MALRYILFLLLFLTGAAQAQETALGGDVFRAGQTVIFDGTEADDLFLAGERVTAAGPITGSAHLAGRYVTAAAEVGRDLYAAGFEVTVDGPVEGDATLAGYRIEVDGTVGGDLRASASSVTVTAPVAGYALLGGEEVRIASAIAGDLMVTGERLAFGPDASVGGTVTVFEEEPGALEVPESVAPADRIVRRALPDWEAETADFRPALVDGRWVVLQFLGGVVVVTFLAALVAALLPRRLAAMRERLLEAPFRSLWIGFLSISVLVGAGFVVALTLIGLLVTPALLLAAGLAGFVGYVIGVYSFGVWLLKLAGRHVPDGFGDRALAAGVGALAAAILALVPFLGWLFVLGLTLAGTGAVALLWLRPRFFAA
ncbi:hypothetical protein [Tranquillimonas alkanivorans]|uniref:DUF8173 domain-containing protein n=1 Tax=Tranquillimonas alkanivorans TaxID=441119 RepID=A0A1I5NE23_9RHOB|nr:hypothetical protein [Tranquillimonas alkanivorans]SFP19636.1 hypothetical protein SAMN04488047_103219 [Tranquillimonas alkanivorans]